MSYCAPARTARPHASSFTPLTSSHRMRGINATAAVASSKSDAYARVRMRRNVCTTNATPVKSMPTPKTRGM